MSKVFSDSDESESGEDFSASEDEWKPDKTDNDDSEDDVEGDAEPNDGEEESPVKRGSQKKKVKVTSKRKAMSTLRSKLFRKYRPPPKTITSPSIKQPIPTKVATLLNNSRFEKTKMLPSTSKSTAAAATYESESDSSDDGGLVAPNDLDLSQIARDAAATSAANSSKEIIPTFDCNAGMRLSDSSDNENDDDANETNEQSTSTNSTEKQSSLIDRINSKSSVGVRDFNDFKTFTKNLDAAKAHMKKLETKHTASSHDENDITKLLSLGEAAAGNVTETQKTSRKRKKRENDSDGSDWENVTSDDDDADGHDHRPKQDIQITVNSNVMRGKSRDEKKALDLEACLKRRLNRDIREKQVFMHKCSFLGWMAHGHHVNRTINNSELMKMCLQHLPSKNAYPDGKTELKYFVSFTKWFHSAFEITSKQMYCSFRPMPPKLTSLALQIQRKRVISKHDFVLIFATMLRAIGIQCRIVINIPVIPLKPPQSELLVITKKENGDEKAKNGDDDDDHDDDDDDEDDSEKNKKKKKPTKSKKKTAKKSKIDSNVTIQKDAKPKTLSQKLKEKVTSDAGGTSKKVNGTAPPAKVKPSKVSSKESEDKPSKANPKGSKVKPSKVNTKESEDKPVNSKESKDKSSEANTKEPAASNSSSTNVPKPEAKTHSSPSSPTDDRIQLTPPKQVTSPLFTHKSKNTQDKSQPKQVKAVVHAAADELSPRKTRKQRQEETAANAALGNTGRTKSRLCLKLPKLPQMDGATDKLPATSKKSKAALMKKTPKKASESDSDFEPTPPKRPRPRSTSAHFSETNKPKPRALDKVKRIDLRVLSSDEEVDPMKVNSSKITTMDTWIETYDEKNKRWIVIDPVRNKVDAVDHIRKFASKPIVYAFAWNNDNTIRDVTPRYCTNFHTSTRKQRADPLWLEMAIRRYEEQKNTRTIIEDVEFSKMHMDTPLPKSISEFKNHPLYALERHLLKFEGIYPPNAMTLGYIRNEPVYARDCVHTLHSREIWVKQARTVKIGEKPYKIVKARPKWNRALNEMEECKPLEIFGHWQTKQYEPPVAENGIVPRNAYGNVELFKPEMLPIGTRHIQLPTLNRVCKKLNVDCAQAVVGFDFHSGSSHPTFDGFVVCEEFADQVIAQWYADQEEVEEKELKKYEARVYGNWKKLIKGLLIRQRLQRKYDFGKTKSK